MSLWGDLKLGCSFLSRKKCCVDPAVLRRPADKLQCNFCLEGIF